MPPTPREAPSLHLMSERYPLLLLAPRRSSLGTRHLSGLSRPLPHHQGLQTSKWREGGHFPVLCNNAGGGRSSGTLALRREGGGGGGGGVRSLPLTSVSASQTGAGWDSSLETRLLRGGGLQRNPCTGEGGTRLPGEVPRGGVLGGGQERDDGEERRGAGWGGGRVGGERGEGRGGAEETMSPARPPPTFQFRTLPVSPRNVGAAKVPSARRNRDGVGRGGEGALGAILRRWGGASSLSRPPAPPLPLASLRRRRELAGAWWLEGKRSPDPSACSSAPAPPCLFGVFFFPLSTLLPFPFPPWRGGLRATGDGATCRSCLVWAEEGPRRLTGESSLKTEQDSYCRAVAL